MAHCTFGVECGKMCAMRTWLRVVSAYTLAFIAHVLLPTAHADDCRGATMIAVIGLAGVCVSLACTINVSIVFWVCPARALWWRTTDEFYNVMFVK